MPKKLLAPELESELNKKDVVPSGFLNLYRWQYGIENVGSCCFCPNKITGGEMYFLIILQKGNHRIRRAHQTCVTRVLISVVATRDKNGKSEDLL